MATFSTNVRKKKKGSSLHVETCLHADLSSLYIMFQRKLKVEIVESLYTLQHEPEIIVIQYKLELFIYCLFFPLIGNSQHQF